MKPAKTEPKTDQVNPVTDAPGGDLDAPEHGIGDRIRAAREARGLSQTALAGRTAMADATGKGVGRTVLFGYESGKFRPGAREIRLICQALSVTPTWLIMGDEAASTQASMELVRQRDWIAAVRLAMAISILKPHERAGFQSLVLSLAGRQLGDMRLSSLLTMGSMVARGSMPELKSWFGEDMDDVSLETLLVRVSDGLHTNVGNKLLLDPDEGDIVGGEWLYKDPDGKTKL
jgi:transcriptional regulator with XRE-family HTH domain